MNIGTPLTRFIIEEQRDFPEATGRFTRLLVELTVAGKIIAREVNKAGLAQVMGLTGRKNIHGEEVQKLDEFANATIIRHIEYLGILAAVASEEMEEIHIVPDKGGEYVMVFDPLDGSSNIDVNVGIGTIFSIFRRKNGASVDSLETDFLRKGQDQVCAGYMIYGSSTMLVYTTGRGVHGFTLDPTIGEFLLSHENIKIPERGSIYSVNEANSTVWEEGMRAYIESLKSPGAGGRSYKARYVGSLVADFHRNLLKGGIFLYPADATTGKGKLRLLYEAAPLALVVRQAGGLASTGREPILEIQPKDIHQTVPLVIGSKLDVEEVESYLRSG
jgi:fructose-1,6-bisphosphatase I